jgi:SH3-like domain-containing protein
MRDTRIAPHRKARIKTEYRPQYPNPITVTAGERLQVGVEDREFPGWKWCKAADGREGWIPIELILGEGSKATILEDYSARELAVGTGEEVMVESCCHEWLLVRNAKGNRGWIPASHAEVL